MHYILINIHHGCSQSERVVDTGPDKAHLEEIAKKDFCKIYGVESVSDMKCDVDFTYYIVPFTGPFNINEIPHKYRYRW